MTPDEQLASALSKTPEELVDDALSHGPPARKCTVCENFPLARALDHFMARKRAGEAAVPLGWFYRTKLRSVFGGPSDQTVKRHLESCRKISVTGEAL